MGVDVDRNRAAAGAEANVMANAIAIPRIFLIHSPMSSRRKRFCR
jgi:hypothetical protein